MQKIIDEVKKMLEESTQKAVGKKLGYSPSYINSLLNGRHGVTPRLAKQFGYRKVVTWEKIDQQG